MKRPTSEIYFYHIPKTAGTSLAGMIRRAYPADECIPAYDIRELLSLPLEQTASYRCYTGHFYSLLEDRMQRELPTVTLLRDPFEQTVSMLKHAQRDQCQSWIDSLKLKRDLFIWRVFLGKRKEIEKQICPFFMNNYQTRALGCDLNALRDFQGDSSGLVIEEYLKSNDLEACFDRAVARLEKMVVVGTVERFRESAGLIFHRMGVTLPDEMPYENVANLAFKRRDTGMSYRDSGAVSDDFSELIDSQNVYDRKLYKIACDRLEADLRKTPIEGC